MLRSLLIFLCCSTVLTAQTDPAAIATAAEAIDGKVIEWRRHVHENPELSNREFETAKFIESKLREIGIEEIKTGIAHTGVVGVLRGGQPGGVIALRADIDALPVTETTDVPFASTAKGEYKGEEVGVMHACGHDTHVAMLLGAAEVLKARQSEIPGTILFVFQPAEEGAPVGEEGGAELMLKEGLFDDYKVERAFGIHINSQTPVGTVRYTPEGAMAAVNQMEIIVKGKQAHGSAPWAGVDPVATAAQIIIGLEMIVARQMELTKAPAVISIGKIAGGVRDNIIPSEVVMNGTIRTLDKGMRADIIERIKKTATNIAEANGAEAEVTIYSGYPVTYNDPTFTDAMLPTLKRTMGENKVVLSRPITGAEDFSFFAEKVPGLFVFLGGMDPEKKPSEVAGHHTPGFYIDERGLKYGVQLYANVALDYLNSTRSR